MNEWKNADHKLDADYDDKKHYDLNEFIKLFKIQFMIYSPKIKTGVSINRECFDKQYGIAKGVSVSSREFIQMIHRARDLTDTNIWMSLPMPRTNRDLNKYDRDYIVDEFDKGTDVLEKIIGGCKVDIKSRVGLTEILAEGCAETKRSKSCFATEVYNQLHNLGLNVKVDMTDREFMILEDDSKVDRWLKCDLLTREEIKHLVKIFMEKEAVPTPTQELHFEFLKIFLKYATTYKENENVIKRFTFDGLFEYDRLETFLVRVKQNFCYFKKEIYDWINLNVIRKNRQSFNYDENLPLDELIDKHRHIAENTTAFSEYKHLKKNTARFFLKMMRELMNGKKHIKKNDIVITHEHVEVLNAVYTTEKKKKGQRDTLTINDKKEDIMRYVSKIINRHYGSKFIVCNSDRNAYIEVSHDRFIMSSYVSDFEERLRQSNIDIEKMPPRYELKNGQDGLDKFFMVKNANRTRPRDRYLMKKDTNGNKIINRKMKNSLYAKPQNTWELDEDTDEYVETAVKTEYGNLGIYEPQLNNVARMSKFITDYDDEKLTIWDLNRERNHTSDNPRYAFYNVELVVDNENIEDDKTRKFSYDKVAKLDKIYKCRGHLLLRDLKYKIDNREQYIMPSYTKGNYIFDICNGYGFIYNGLSVPLVFYRLKMSYGYNINCRYEIDFNEPYDMRHMVNGHYINTIYITHLEVSPIHHLTNAFENNELVT